MGCHDMGIDGLGVQVVGVQGVRVQGVGVQGVGVQGAGVQGVGVQGEGVQGAVPIARHPWNGHHSDGVRTQRVYPHCRYPLRERVQNGTVCRGCAVCTA
jgi:hypothetical protein